MFTRGATWLAATKRGKSTIESARLKVIERIKGDLAKLKADPKLKKTVTVCIYDKVGQIRLMLGNMELEAVQTAETNLAKLEAGLTEHLFPAISRGDYDDVIAPAMQKAQEQMTKAQAERRKVDQWLKTLPQDQQSEYEGLATIKARHEWRKAKGYTK